MEFNKAKGKRRMIAVLVMALLILILLITKIGWIQFVQGAELQEKAYKQQTLNQIISPKRGTIYDSTKEKILAISATVETISINPRLIKEENKEKVAKAFSDIFELEYETMLEKVNKDTSIETIIKKVEKNKVDELREWMKTNKISSGINIDEDSKRYYPYDSLASHLIGFCGDENQGMEGIEHKLDSSLKGTVGKIVVAKNAKGEELPNGEETYVPSENGNDIVLTIDANIQMVAEKYLKQAVIENECTEGGNVVIMNPKNGDILAMATYPDYNLNSPFEINTDFFSGNWDELSSDDKKNVWYKMWRNKAISDTYEPGSTFKLITAAIGLEESLTVPNRAGEFSCTGTTELYDEKINCLKRIVHGQQSLTDALCQSCNSAFIQLGQKIGNKTFYKYLEAFGFMSKTGVDLPGEATGLFPKEDERGPVELATLSFGQRFKITPLQLTTAVSAIVNDGKLMKPRIVKQIIDTDNSITTEVEPVFVRQVISAQTSETMRGLMETVVVEGSAKHAAVQGYTIGGKTGTSEDGVNTNKYVASFIGVAPVENPRSSYACYFI